MTIDAPERPPRRRRNLLARWRRRAYRALPFAAWVGVLVLVLGYAQRDRVVGELRGIAEVARHRITTPVAGTLELLSVADHDPVTAGQIVAALGDSELRLRLSRARIELEVLRAELLREEQRVALDTALDRTDLAANRAADLRRFHRDVESALIDTLTTRAEIEETIVRQRGIGIERDRTRELVARGVEAESSETGLDTGYAALGVRIAELRGILSEREARVVTARERLAAAETAMTAPVVETAALLEPFRWRIRAQEVELETLALIRDQITLRAPVGGRVEQVYFRPGERVAAGDVLATVVEDATRTVVVYVPEAMRGSLASSARPQLADVNTPSRFVPATIESVAPSVALTPRRLWLDPQREEWSIPVRLSTSQSMLPGQSVVVRWQR